MLAEVYDTTVVDISTIYYMATVYTGNAATSNFSPSPFYVTRLFLKH